MEIIKPIGLAMVVILSLVRGNYGVALAASLLRIVESSNDVRGMTICCRGD